MRILDRERYWAYIKAYLICFTALVGLYIVIDAFSNFDEFTKRTSGVTEIAQIMGRFYLVHMTEMYDRLCGVIGMMAAIFTVTWMQRDNELLAMLAAGISHPAGDPAGHPGFDVRQPPGRRQPGVDHASVY